MTNPDVSVSAARFLAEQAEYRKRRMAELHSRCEKRSFESEREARNRLHDIQLESTDLRVPIRWYRCEKCTLFHLTSKPLDSSGKVWKAKNR